MSPTVRTYFIPCFAAFFIMLGTAFHAQAQRIRQDTTRSKRQPIFKFSDRYGDPFSTPQNESPLYLKDPALKTLEVEIDTGMNYTIYEKFGEIDYRPITTMSFQEFKRYQEQQQLKNYWKSQSKAASGESEVAGKGFTPKIFISPVLDRLFGSSYVELIPKGFVTLDFGGEFQKINNPNVSIRQQRNGGFIFDQQISMNVTGKVGEKLAVTANFDNNNSFDFQNNFKVEYTGYKEDILKKLELGNVSLPLNNTLIQGAQNLFGIKTQMQFGKLTATAVASTQRGKVSSIDIPGGSNGQGRPFELIASDYDENRHFFLGHFFRDNYENWISVPPNIISGVNIMRVEVYVLNRNNETQTLRNVVGLMDLGEARRIYDTNSIQSNGVNLPNGNGSNTLFSTLVGPGGPSRNSDGITAVLDGIFSGDFNNGVDYEKINGARKLSPTEFTVHPQLGYITLTRRLQNDEALAVAYEYTYNGVMYKVGELSDDYASLKEDESIYLKMLRPREIAIRDQFNKILPTWELMMRNIYTLNVNQLTRDGFELRIIYRDDRTGIDNPQLQEGTQVRNRQLIEILGLDRLGPSNDPQRDGNFDFVENLTISTKEGLIIFPMLEPFGKGLRIAFEGENNEDFLVAKYAFDTLYRSTRTDAQLLTTKNKFFLTGRYNAGSAQEIMIPGFGVSQGSVRVYAGGVPLQEGLDYQVDYNFGRVTILNAAILNSGKNISVQYETSDPFSFQTRSLIGTRLDYRLSEDVNLGGTLLYYNERQQLTRNQIGTEPARNIQYGLDLSMRKNSRLLTKMIDALPIIQTKEQSSYSFTGEFAQLIPGTSNKTDGDGASIVDDFENTATPYSLMSPQGWKLSSIPKAFDPTGGVPDNVEAGYRRAKIAWYQIDNQFYRDVGRFKPENITDKDLQNHYVRSVWPNEIFAGFQNQQGNFYEQIFDIAYYPSERGPYNYNYQLNSDGFLTEPKRNWAGITSAIRTEVDFDKANIEYVEFWLLDPFINTPNGRIVDGQFNKTNTTGGKVLLQLGTISEDVQRDGKHAFEQGLPVDGVKSIGVTQNEWGYVTSQQYVVNAFANESSARANQDVGLDGAQNTEEAELYRSNFLDRLIVNADVKAAIEGDPSADDFQYFLGEELDNADAKLLQRYKNYNGLDGNSPVITGNDAVTPSGTNVPDNEDLNADNTLNELEEYYQYSIDLRPGQLDIGRGYIVDKITRQATGTGDKTELVTWYLFRVPVRQPESKVGNISGYKSIRYARLVLTDFAEPAVLRMAKFRMVGSRWRRYEGSLLQGGLVETPEPAVEDFTVSTVNIEENSAGDDQKSPYVVPPGVVRDRDITSTVDRQLNEQSVQMCVDDLRDADARAIYKNVDMDFFNYGRIKMYIHANSNAADGELYAFLRLGNDPDQNYYEIAIPLKISNPLSFEPREVWPLENEIDIALDELYALKVERDRNNFSLSQSYPLEGPRQAGKHLIRIFGRPDLADVRTIIIGVRNPQTVDQRSYQICLWANELRLTDFDRTAGYAVNTALTAKLADFATVSGVLRYNTYGFGNISSKISERSREERTAYDVTAAVNADKLLPGNHGIKIPMLLSYQKTTSKPQYDPANPDLKIEAALASFQTEGEREAYLNTIRDVDERKGINFTNVRKTKVKKDAKSHIYDIENFSFSYSYSEAMRRSFTLKESALITNRGSVAYSFTPKATGIEPFKNVKSLKSPYLQLIRDFNFSLMPSNLSFRADLDRSFSKIIYRNDGFESTPNYLKNFTFNRTYNVRWNLAKSLSLDYSARANAFVDEIDTDPNGGYSYTLDREITAKEYEDSLRTNLKNLGRMKNFDQSVTVNYILPLDKLPLTNWIGAEYRYNVNYNWVAGAVNKPDSLKVVGDIPDDKDFKNTIQNSRTQDFTGKIDLVKLYNKVAFLKKINTPPPAKPKNPQVKTKPDPADTLPKPPKMLTGLARLIMSVRSINGTYSKNEGTVLPGFVNTPKYFGMDENFSSPGWGFVLGDQDPGIRQKASQNGWLTTSPTLSNPFRQIRNVNITARANIEPAPDFKIQLDIKKESMAAYQEFYRFDQDSLDFRSIGPTRSGSYRISTIMINTSFNKSNGKLESAIFDTFEDNLAVVQQRFNTVTGIEYDTAQDVLIPAFIAAYTGKDINTVGLSPFPQTPLPNWRVDYSGLTKLKIFGDLFQSLTLTHAYVSTYSVVDFRNSAEYTSDATIGLGNPIEDYNKGIFATQRNEQGKLIPVYVISGVTLSEQFSPLIGINLRTKSRISARFEYKTKRDLALNISNAQVTEALAKDILMEMGYTKNNMKLPFRSQGRLIVLKNDVTFRLNLTVSDIRTIQRKIEQPDVFTSGNVNFQLRPNISYAVNQKLQITTYFEQTINEPKVSNAYRRATTRFGFQVRFNLAQ